MHPLARLRIMITDRDAPPRPGPDFQSGPKVHQTSGRPWTNVDPLWGHTTVSSGSTIVIFSDTGPAANCVLPQLEYKVRIKHLKR